MLITSILVISNESKETKKPCFVSSINEKSVLIRLCFSKSNNSFAPNIKIRPITKSDDINGQIESKMNFFLKKSFMHRLSISII